MYAINHFSALSLTSKEWALCIIGAVISFAIAFAIYLVQKKESGKHKKEHDARFDELKNLHKRDSEKIQVLCDLILSSQKSDIGGTESAVLESKIEVAASLITDEDSDKAQALKAIARKENDRAEELLAKVAQQEHDLIEVYTLNSMHEFRQGNYAQALTWYKKLQGLQPDNFEVTNNIIYCYYWLKNFTEVRDLVQKTIDSLDKKDERYKDKKLRLYKLLERTYTTANEIDKREDIINKCRELTISLYGETSIQMAGVYRSLAALSFQKQKYEESISYDLAALNLRKSGSEEDERANADVYQSIAITYRQAGKYRDGLEAVQKAISIWLKYLPSDHTYLGIAYRNLGLIYSTLHDFTLAEDYYLRAREIFAKRLGTEHKNYKLIQSNLAIAFANQNKFPEAEYLFRELIDNDARDGIEDMSAASHLDNLAALMVDLGRFEEAESLMLKAGQIMDKLSPPESSTLLIHNTNLSHVYFQNNEHEKAVALLQEVIDAYRRCGRENTVDMASVKMKLGDFYVLLDKWELAEPLLKESLAYFKAHLPDSMIYHENLTIMTKMLTSVNRIEEAEEFKKQAEEVLARYNAGHNS